ncbi:MAG: hypothetical protein K2W82_11115 [Candidatus Obscuribacterales bacterium]|nr:hypothetical protein [Candidatus Obscuribacterales bacterium]
MEEKRIELIDSKDLHCSAVSRGGRYLLNVHRTRGESLLLLTDRVQQFVTPLRSDSSVNAVCLRSKMITLSSSKQPQTAYELVYALEDEAGHVRRQSLPDCRKLRGMDTGMHDVFMLVESHDGRYLAVTGKNAKRSGSTDIQIWSLDQEPALCASFTVPIRDRPYAMCFNRNNSELCISFRSGQILSLDIFNQTVHPLHWPHREIKRWYCTSIDYQPASKNCFAFGGSYSSVWFINCSYPLATDFDPLDTPFLMTESETVTGLKFTHIVGMPKARLSCLHTGIGIITHLKFLNHSELLVTGEFGTELWDLSTVSLREKLASAENDSIAAVGCLEAGKALVVRT